ncbi:arsenate reductase ArsC [Paraburkholderia bryophila]|uniref:arsenate reductase ArsC n=1 Tax=Paraburkholderia bryophila TaxID=420952 RepID=UPI00234A5E3B|nr:arsenate reductase ArsC [Paraburkholderia bryophila]WCM18303.1 arsenate reductase ArsC [Paraburkholderia bryophila]WCM23612.1 arsenate reductase ArsC [Paraburkholderia bryophila]
MVEKYNVLFLCRANSARSIMAEALLRELGGGRFEAHSAGIEPAVDVHPMTLEQLRPTIEPLGKLRPKSWDQFVGPSAPEMDVIIALCDEAGEAHAPAFSGTPTFCQWNFADPLAAAAGAELEQKRVFEQVFRQILRRVSLFVALPLHSMRPSEQRAAVDAMDDHSPSVFSLDGNS